MFPKAGYILDGDFWPESVRVLTVEPVGSRTSYCLRRSFASDSLSL